MVLTLKSLQSGGKTDGEISKLIIMMGDRLSQGAGAKHDWRCRVVWSGKSSWGKCGLEELVKFGHVVKRCVCVCVSVYVVFGGVEKEI